MRRTKSGDTMNKTLTTAFIAIACFAGTASADRINHKSAKVSMEVPDGWKSEIDGDQISLQTKKGDVFITMVTVDDSMKKDAVKNVKKFLDAKIDKLSLSKPKDMTIGGMKAVVIDGDGFVDVNNDGTKDNIDLSIMVLDAPPADKDLLVFAFAEDATLAKHKDEIIAFFNSFKTTK